MSRTFFAFLKSFSFFVKIHLSKRLVCLLFWAIYEEIPTFFAVSLAIFL